MEESTSYIVEITEKAEQYYWKLLAHIYEYHSIESANRKSDELLELAMSLNNNPHRGRLEEDLTKFRKEFRYLLYNITKRKAVKIIYFIEEETHKVYVTDFFTTLMNPEKRRKRN